MPNKVVNGVSDADVLRIMQKVKSAIRRDPDSYDQMNFCGTACCIAGHVDLVANGRVAVARHQEGVASGFEVVGLAAIALGRRPLLDSLFWSSNWVDRAGPVNCGGWPMSVRVRGPITSDHGCAAIDWWLKENGIDPNSDPEAMKQEAATIVHGVASHS